MFSAVVCSRRWASPKPPPRNSSPATFPPFAATLGDVEFTYQITRAYAWVAAKGAQPAPTPKDISDAERKQRRSVMNDLMKFVIENDDLIRDISVDFPPKIERMIVQMKIILQDMPRQQEIAATFARDPSLSGRGRYRASADSLRSGCNTRCSQMRRRMHFVDGDRGVVRMETLVEKSGSGRRDTSRNIKHGGWRDRSSDPLPLPRPALPRSIRPPRRRGSPRTARNAQTEHLPLDRKKVAEGERGPVSPLGERLGEALYRLLAAHSINGMYLTLALSPPPQTSEGNFRRLGALAELRAP